MHFERASGARSQGASTSAVDEPGIIPGELAVGRQAPGSLVVALTLAVEFLATVGGRLGHGFR